MFYRKISPDVELRTLEPSDAEELFALIDRNRDYLKRWMRWVDNIRGVEDCVASRKKALERFAEDGSFDAGIFERGKLVGMASFHEISWLDQQASMGYWLSEDAQGRGLMTMACAAMVGHAFEELKLNRVEIRAVTDNARSRAVPERLGFRHEGVFRKAYQLHGSFHDLEIYGLLREEWQAVGWTSEAG